MFYTLFFHFFFKLLEQLFNICHFFFLFLCLLKYYMCLLFPPLAFPWLLPPPSTRPRLLVSVSVGCVYMHAHRFFRWSLTPTSTLPCLSSEVSVWRFVWCFSALDIIFSFVVVCWGKSSWKLNRGEKPIPSIIKKTLHNLPHLATDKLFLNAVLLIVMRL